MITPASVAKNIELKDHCSYHTGGPARYFVMPKHTDELIEILKWRNENDIPSIIMGMGSNMLFAEKGFDGLVISLKHLNPSYRIEENRIHVGAGAILDEIVYLSLLHNLAGMEDLSGIPGCIGGNVFMNAGAFDTEMKDIVTHISVLTPELFIQKLSNTEVGFDYRKTHHLKGKIVLAAELELSLQTDNVATMNRRKEILGKRHDKQPLDLPSCGSVFKRPPNNYAGVLIEQSGLKGYKIGGATVSEKHANFIVNSGNASSQDIYDLIQHVKATVQKDSGIILEEEVKLIGFDDK